jgi:hypothetical protein
MFPLSNRNQIILCAALQAFWPAFRIAAAPIHWRKFATTEAWMANNRILYLIIGAVGVLGYNLCQARKEPEGLQINVGPNGLKIQNK